MSQTSDEGVEQVAAGPAGTGPGADTGRQPGAGRDTTSDVERGRSTDATKSGGAAGTPDPDAAGSAAEAAADDPDATEVQRAPRAAEEVEQDDRAGADEEAADDQADQEAEAQRQRSAEEFAAQHDPVKHDVGAGEEFRQPGDWVADEQAPQEWDSEGNLVSGGGPGSEPAGQPAEGPPAAGAADGSQEATGASTSSTSSTATGTSGSGRRVSDLAEVRDGGYSVGSAATIDDGAMPLGHPVKGWEDTKSYVTPDHPRYDDAEPHVWFTDPDSAERAGFHRAD